MQWRKVGTELGMGVCSEGEELVSIEAGLWRKRRCSKPVWELGLEGLCWMVPSLS